MVNKQTLFKKNQELNFIYLRYNDEHRMNIRGILTQPAGFPWRHEEARDVIEIICADDTTEMAIL